MLRSSRSLSLLICRSVLFVGSILLCTKYNNFYKHNVAQNLTENIKQNITSLYYSVNNKEGIKIVLYFIRYVDFVVDQLMSYLTSANYYASMRIWTRNYVTLFSQPGMFI